MVPTLDSKSTLEPKLDLSHIPQSVLVPILFILGPKLTTPLSHIPLLDLSIEQNDPEIIFQEWSDNRKNFHIRILHDPFQSRGYKNVNKKGIIKDGFLETPYYLD